jgi:hypothetical protein
MSASARPVNFGAPRSPAAQVISYVLIAVFDRILAQVGGSRVNIALACSRCMML